MIVDDIRGWMGPDIRLTVDEKPRKNPQPGKLSRPVIEPDPTG